MTGAVLSGHRKCLRRASANTDIVRVLGFSVQVGNRNMTPYIESFYLRIGQAAFDSALIEFTDLWVSSEVSDDFSGTEMFIRDKSGTFRYQNTDVEVLDRLFCELNAAFVKEGIARWTSATFKMSADGQFSIDFGYGDVEDFDRALERRAEWVAKFLGADAQVDYSPL